MECTLERIAANNRLAAAQRHIGGRFDFPVFAVVNTPHWFIAGRAEIPVFAIVPGDRAVCRGCGAMGRGLLADDADTIVCPDCWQPDNFAGCQL